MNKPLMSKSNHLKYIDVWTVNLFNPRNEDPFDVVSLFMMQLGCIINMLPVWKRLQLRVFICDVADMDRSRFEHIVQYFSCLKMIFKILLFFFVSNLSVNSIPFEKPAESRLHLLLKQLRIQASIHQIPEWSGNEDFVRHSSILKQFTNSSETPEQVIAQENINRAKLHMQR